MQGCDIINERSRMPKPFRLQQGLLYFGPLCIMRADQIKDPEHSEVDVTRMYLGYMDRSFAVLTAGGPIVKNVDPLPIRNPINGTAVEMAVSNC